MNEALCEDAEKLLVELIDKMPEIKVILKSASHEELESYYERYKVYAYTPNLKSAGVK